MVATVRMAVADFRRCFKNCRPEILGTVSERTMQTIFDTLVAVVRLVNAYLGFIVAQVISLFCVADVPMCETTSES